MDTFGSDLDTNGIVLDNFGCTLETFGLRNVPQKHKKYIIFSPKINNPINLHSQLRTLNYDRLSIKTLILLLSRGDAGRGFRTNLS